jgi:CheY-like chemotaxis protein
MNTTPITWNLPAADGVVKAQEPRQGIFAGDVDRAGAGLSRPSSVELGRTAVSIDTAVERAPRRTALEPVRVMIVDDQAAFRAVARELIGTMAEFNVIMEAASGTKALEAARRVHPQMTLVDVRMPGMSGIETSRQLLAGEASMVVVLVTSSDPQDFTLAARSCGAVALLSKQHLNPQVLRGTWAVHGAL